MPTYWAPLPANVLDCPEVHGDRHRPTSDIVGTEGLAQAHAQDARHASEIGHGLHCTIHTLKTTISRKYHTSHLLDPEEKSQKVTKCKEDKEKGDTPFTAMPDGAPGGR